MFIKIPAALPAAGILNGKHLVAVYAFWPLGKYQPSQSPARPNETRLSSSSVRMPGVRYHMYPG